MSQTNHVPIRVDMIDADVLDVAGKSFIQPQIVPPFHRHQISEPLSPLTKQPTYPHINTYSINRFPNLFTHVI